MKLSDLNNLEQINESDTFNEVDVIELIKAAIDLNLSVPVSITNEINRKSNKLEKAIKKLGYNPRKRLR